MRSLAISEKVHDPDHPHVASILNNWVVLLCAQVIDGKTIEFLAKLAGSTVVGESLFHDEVPLLVLHVAMTGCVLERWHSLRRTEI